MGDRIDFRDGRWVVPDRPTIPFIEGDGTGPDIWRAARQVFDGAVEKVSRGKRRIEWVETLAGEKAFKQTGSWLPEATLETIRLFMASPAQAQRCASMARSVSHRPSTTKER